MDVQKSSQPLLIRLSQALDLETLSVVLNGVDVTGVLDRTLVESFQPVVLPLRRGRNALIIRGAAEEHFLWGEPESFECLALIDNNELLGWGERHRFESKEEARAFLEERRKEWGIAVPEEDK